MNISSRIEVGNNLQIAWLEDFVEGIVNLVCCRFVGNVASPEFVQPELKGFELYYILVGNIVYLNRGEIGIATAWTKAGELGEGYADSVILFGRRILPNLKLSFLYCFLAILLFHSIRIITPDIRLANIFPTSQNLSQWEEKFSPF